MTRLTKMPFVPSNNTALQYLSDPSSAQRTLICGCGRPASWRGSSGTGLKPVEHKSLLLVEHTYETAGRKTHQRFQSTPGRGQISLRWTATLTQCRRFSHCP